MRFSLIVFLLLSLSLCGLQDPVGSYSEEQPRYHRTSSRVEPSPAEKERAEVLFRLARRENRRLIWNGCLARKAFLRAKTMAEEDCFAHRDPRTGKNPAWEMVVQCSRYRFAAENLAKGRASALACHDALMESPSHRANVTSPRHQFLGVGCYDDLCVELFAGY